MSEAPFPITADAPEVILAGRLLLGVRRAPKRRARLRELRELRDYLAEIGRPDRGANVVPIRQPSAQQATFWRAVDIAREAVAAELARIEAQG